MIIIKYIVILIILAISAYIGNLYSKRYSGRVIDLEEMKNALIMFKAKIKFTYEPIPEVFKEISKQSKKNIGNIFLKASKYMESDVASVGWEKAVEDENVHTNFNKEDIEIIKNLSKMLGNTDLEGQTSSIDLTNNFLDRQIEEAQIEKSKNVKLYRTLGAGIGLTIAIILV